MKTITIDGQKYELTPITQEKKLVVKKDFNFEIYPDELGKMRYIDAVEKIEELGDGWRFPHITEIQILCESKYKELFKRSEWYWILSDDNNFNNAFAFQFKAGYINYAQKFNEYYVMAVRDLTPQVETNI